VHLLLTDRLVCPRCGPEFGLILLAERMQERRVLEGALGCPNCRDQFRIDGGLADLRAPPRGPLEPGLVGAGSTSDDEDAVDNAERIRALLGIVGGPGTVALLGGPARHAAALASAVRDLQAVAVDADLAGWADVEGVSRMVARPGIPFFSGVLRGVVVDGRLGTEWMREAARVVAPRSRVVVVGAAEQASETLASAGLVVLAEEAQTVVAARG